MSTDKALHDQLKAQLPEGASCIDDCPYCTSTDPKGETQVSEKVYTQEALDALVADARAKAAEEARSEADKALAEIQAKLADAESARDEASSRVEELQAEISKRDEEARLAELAEERAKKVADVTDFSDEQIEERKATWASLDETAFEQVLSDFKAVTESAKKHEEKGKKNPPGSKIGGTRETAGEAGTDTQRLREFFSASTS